MLIDLAAQLEGAGIAPDALCRAARVDAEFLARPHERIPGSAAARIWTAAQTLTGDPLLGLHVAERHRPGAINILGYVFMNCRTARDALERLTRFAALLNDGLRVRVSQDRRLLVVHLEPVPGMRNFLIDDGRQVMESMAAGLVLTLRRVADRPFVPAQVWFRHAAGGAAAEYHRVFGAPARFGQAEDRVALHARELDAPIPSADPTLLRLFEQHAAERLLELERHGATARRVGALVAARLDGTAPAVDDIARELAMSTRQLQRRLREEGTSFQDLLDATRRELALVRLRQPGATAAEVALLLGFSEASAFTRAFRRWTGTTPSAWADAGRAG